MKARSGVKYAGFGLLGIAAVFGFALVVMWLWNALVPELFNGPVLSYWQTFGLLILSKIIFSGIGRGPGDRSSHARKYRHEEDFPRSRWRMKFDAKMNGKVEKEEPDGKEEGPLVSE
jgi:hypothetical protein